MLLFTVSFGVYLNDEGAQLQGVESVRHGSFEIEERLPHFYAVKDGVMLPGWNGTTTHNVFVSMLAVPAYGAFWALSLVLAPTTVLLLAWTSATYITATRGWSRLYNQRTGRTWNWYNQSKDNAPGKDGEASKLRRVLGRVQSMTIAHWALVALLALWTFTQWVQLPDLDFALWGEVFAVQGTHTFLSAAGFVLFYRLIQRETESPRAAWIASAALLLGPFLFWGVGIKYHGPSMVLAIATLWAYGHPHRFGRLAAFIFAVLGGALTPLGAPLFIGLAIVEVVRTVRAFLQREAGPDRTRQALMAFGVLAASLLVLGIFNKITSGTWLGERLHDWDRSFAGLWTWLQVRIRFESVGQSFSNLWRLFMNARMLAGGPLSIWTLTPFAVLALVVPFRLRKKWPRTLAVAFLSSVLFVAAFVHAAHTQGDGQDNRFFATALPGFILLAAVVAAPRLEAMEHNQVRWVSRAALGTFVLGMLILLALAAANYSIIAGDELRQVLNLAWLLGTVSWLTLLAIEAIPVLATRLGKTRSDSTYSVALGIGLACGALWLFLMMIGVHRSIPPWPFGSDAEGMSFLMPSLDSMRQWWIPRIIP